jgi:hypothetical protein
VNGEDVAPLIQFYTEGKKEGGFEDGIELALRRILASPDFVLRMERDSPASTPGTIHRISDLELASRLSFFLWSSIPDDELIDLGARGVLHTPRVLEQQMRRMIADRRSAALVENFAGQWLYLRDLVAVKRPDDRLFPNFDEGLRHAMALETQLFVEAILREDRSVFDLLGANFTFLNDRLARHYGIPDVYGSQFRRVVLPDDSPRRGLLGQGSVLTVTSYANRTSPVNRGKFIRDAARCRRRHHHPTCRRSRTPMPRDTSYRCGRGWNNTARTPRARVVTPRWTRSDSPSNSSTPSASGVRAANPTIRSTPLRRSQTGRSSPASMDCDTCSWRRPSIRNSRAPWCRRCCRMPGPRDRSDRSADIRAIMHDAAPRRFGMATLVRGIVNSVPFQWRLARDSRGSRDGTAIDRDEQ